MMLHKAHSQIMTSDYVIKLRLELGVFGVTEIS